jgi:hypothetical protein
MRAQRRLGRVPRGWRPTPADEWLAREMARAMVKAYLARRAACLVVRPGVAACHAWQMGG